METTNKDHKNKRTASSSTRLQKHAPPYLQLRGITGEAEEYDGSAARYAIPLLSPLLVSPPAPVVVVDVKGEELAKGGGGKETAPAPAEGWKHPAVGGMMETPDLGALLRSQCMLINNV